MKADEIKPTQALPKVERLLKKPGQPARGLTNLNQPEPAGPNNVNPEETPAMINNNP